MKIVRIVISLALVGVAVFLMFDDFKKREFYTFSLKHESKGADPVEQWRIQKELDTWVESEVAKLGLKANKTEGQYSVYGEKAQEEALQKITDDWNALWEKQNAYLKKQGEEKAAEKKLRIDMLTNEVVALLESISQVEGKIFKNAPKAKAFLEQIDIDRVDQEGASEPMNEALKIVETEKEEKLEVGKVEANDAVVAESVISPLSVSGNAQKETVLANQLSKLQGDLTSLQDTIEAERMVLQKNQEKNLKAISSSMEELKTGIDETQNLSDQKKSDELYSYVKTIDARVQKQIQGLLGEIKNRDQYEQQLFELEKSNALVALKHKKLSVEQELSFLKTEENVEEELDLVSLRLSSEKTEAQVASLFGSYKIFLFALIGCFVFNYIWELIAQRKRV